MDCSRSAVVLHAVPNLRIKSFEIRPAMKLNTSVHMFAKIYIQYLQQCKW